MVLRIEDISFIGVYINDSFRDFKDIDDYANYHVSLLNNSKPPIKYPLSLYL